MSSLSQSNKRAASMAFQPEGQEGRIIEACPNSVLPFALVWLEPGDVAKCTQVCQHWNQQIQENDYVWKLAALNVASGAAFEALETAIGGGDPNDPNRPILGYQNMAKGFASFSKTPKSEINAACPTREPVLKKEDLFLLLELKHLGVVLGAWCQSLEGFEFSSSRRGNTIDFIPDDSQETVVQIPEGRVIFDDIGATLSLWRRDTGQSYSFSCFEQQLGSYEIGKDIGGNITTSSQFQAISFDEPTENTIAGLIARNLCHGKDMTFMDLRIKLCVRPDLPMPASSDEPEWLEEFRNSTQADMNDDRLWYYHRKFQDFCRRYHVSSVQVKIEFPEVTNQDGEPQKFYLLFLEGLAWV